MKKYAVISMDVEDWYHTYFAGQAVDRSASMMDGLDIVLDIMKQYHIHGSFFVVGELVGMLEDKLRKMDREGHDISCHGNIHIRPMSLSEEQFENQLLDGKRALETALGHNVLGYRAPDFALDDERQRIVERCGFRYDSSKLKPQKSSKYGFMSLPGFCEEKPCIHRRNGFVEFEVSTQPLGSLNMLLGGGYIRMLPWFFMKYMTQKYINTGKPYVMYIHPIDLSAKAIPKMKKMGFSKYLRTHIGRGRPMQRRLRKVIELLQRNGYEFVTFAQLMAISGETVK